MWPGARGRSVGDVRVRQRNDGGRRGEFLLRRPLFWSMTGRRWLWLCRFAGGGQCAASILAGPRQKLLDQRRVIDFVFCGDLRKSIVGPSAGNGSGPTSASLVSSPAVIVMMAAPSHPTAS